MEKHSSGYKKVPDSKAGKKRTHFDIAVPDIDRAMEQITALGGKQVHRAEQPYLHIIASDPDGNEFCLGTDKNWAFIKG